MNKSLPQILYPLSDYQKLFEKAFCEKRQIKYHKYGHERINFFENELIRFLAS